MDDRSDLITRTTARSLLAVVLVGALAAGCGLIDPASPTPGTTPERMVQGVWTPPAWEPSDAPLLIFACVDVTDGYPEEYRRHALGLLAEGVEALTAPGGSQVVVFAWMMTANSFADRNTIAAIDVPPLPPALEPPPTVTAPPTPTWGFIDPQGRRTAEAKATADALGVEEANRINATAWAEVSATAAATARAEAERVAAFAEQLRAFRPALSREDRANLDALGCISRAGEQFARHDGRKLLLIASDLDGTGEQQLSPKLDLTGVVVRVIDFPSADAGPADGWYFRTNHWRRQFADAGTWDVTFFAPAESQLLTLVDLAPKGADAGR